MDPRINHHPKICNRINRLLFSGPTAIGGMLLSGIVGLFIGAIVLALGIRFFRPGWSRNRIQTGLSAPGNFSSVGLQAGRSSVPGLKAPWFFKP